jgi:hypothetical protein
VGEVIDSCEFHRALDVISPRRQMTADLWRLLAGRGAP